MAQPAKGLRYRKEYRHAYYLAHKENNLEYTRAWRLRNPEGKLLISARQRAKKAGVPFNLEVCDVLIPEVCPILGIPLKVNHKANQPGPGSPSIDRLVPNRGYVKGNIAVISHRANTIKSSASVVEVEAVLNWMKLNVPS